VKLEVSSIVYFVRWLMLPKVLYLVCCGFVNEEFPAEIQKFAKMQQTLVKLKLSNFFYTVLAVVFIQAIVLI
jgi:hypothetical protein